MQPQLESFPGRHRCLAPPDARSRQGRPNVVVGAEKLPTGKTDTSDLR
jgi:hypothetical protein